MSRIQDIQAKIRARHPVLLVRTHERLATARLVGAIQEAHPDIPVQVLLFTPGPVGVRPVEATKVGQAWMLKDLEAPQPPEGNADPATWLLKQVMLREEAQEQQKAKGGAAITPQRTVVLVQSPASWLNDYTAGLLSSFAERARALGWIAVLAGELGEIPLALSSLPVLNMPLPTVQELSTHLAAAVAAGQAQCGEAPAGMADTLAAALVGLTETEAQDVVSQALSAGYLKGLRNSHFWADVVAAMGSLKAELLQTVAGMRLHQPLPNGLDGLGGLVHLKKSLWSVARRYSAQARRLGLTPGGATLCVGVPGTGKTLAARALAGAINMLVVELDMGTVQSKWVGESEGQLEMALTRLEAFGPCVLLLDEAGKLFDIETADDVYVRLFTRLIKFLEEVKVNGTPIHVFLTSNEYKSMRAEFLSRMDAVWWFGFPGLADRRAILQAVAGQLVRRAVTIRGNDSVTPDADPWDYSAVDFAAVAAATEGYTGRDLRKVLEQAATLAFEAAGRPDTALVLSCLGNVPSTQDTAQEKVIAMFEEVLAVSGGEILLAAEPSEADRRTWYPLYEARRNQ